MKTLVEQFINKKFNEAVSYLSGDDMIESEAGFYYMMGWDGNKGMPTASVVVEDANKYKLVETMLNEIQENRDRISEFCFYPVTYLEAYTLKKYYTSPEAMEENHGIFGNFYEEHKEIGPFCFVEDEEEFRAYLKNNLKDPSRTEDYVNYCYNFLYDENFGGNGHGRPDYYGESGGYSIPDRLVDFYVSKLNELDIPEGEPGEVLI